MKRIARQKCWHWWTINTKSDCEICGKESEYVIIAYTFFWRKIACLCAECRRKWLKNEVTI